MPTAAGSRSRARWRCKPRLLLLDEPTAGMNPTETAEMLEIIRTLKGRLHHPADRAQARPGDAALRPRGGDGRRREDRRGLAREVAVDPAVIEAYLGSREVGRGARSRPRLRHERAILKLDRINSFYGPVQVHYDFSIEVGRGQIVCLLGGNASGKSTTMKVILGLLKPRSGDVILDGEPITGLPTPQIIRRGIGSVPEARRLFGAMTVRENLLMGAYHARRQGRDRAGLRAHADAVPAPAPSAPARPPARSRAASSRWWRWRAR